MLRKNWPQRLRTSQRAPCSWLCQEKSRSCGVWNCQPQNPMNCQRWLGFACCKRLIWMRLGPRWIACLLKPTKPPRPPLWLPTGPSWNWGMHCPPLLRAGNLPVWPFSSGAGFTRSSWTPLVEHLLLPLTLPEDHPWPLWSTALFTEWGPQVMILKMSSETIRLVSAWRMTEDKPVGEIVVSGPEELADHLVDRLRSALGLSVHLVAAPLDTALAADVEHPAGTPWGLVGLGRAHLLSHPRIDLQHPRAAQDLSGPRRRRGTLLAGVILVLFGWIWSSGNKEVRQLQAQIDLLRPVLPQQTQVRG